MTDSAVTPVEQMRLIFTHLTGLVRTAGLYQANHPQTRRAKEVLYRALATFLDAHGKLTYRFLGDLLIANDRILPRESLVYRQFLDVCQTERGIGTVTFQPGLEEREIDGVFDAFTGGIGPDPAGWLARRRLAHVALGSPVEPQRESGEVVARRAYYGSIEALREIEASIRSREPLTMEQFTTLRTLTSTLLEQILTTPGLVLRLASIKSYDEYTLYHSVNVAVISIGLGALLGLPQDSLREVGMGGMLHDLGKIAVPLEVIRKPDLLDEGEWRAMRRHPILGADLLSRMPGANRLPMIVAFEHHMRFDGKGYPFVRGDWFQHPVSRLACLADVFDAMTSRRAYKKALPTEAVCGYLRDEAGKAFDPRLVAVVERMVRTLRAEAPLEASA